MKKAVIKDPPAAVLYVEDHAESFALLEQLLAKRADLQLLRALNGTRAIALARSARPDVILLNVDLPGISAVEFMKLLRAGPAPQSTPILALGADGTPEAIVKAIEAGFFQYLTKPLKAEPFMEALTDALEFSVRERAEENDMPLRAAHRP